MLSASVYKLVFINCIYIIRLKSSESNIYIYNVLCGKGSSVISSISEGLCKAAALLCCRLVTQSLQQQSMPRSNRSVPTDSPITRYGGVRSGAPVWDGVRCGVVGKVPVGVRIPGGNAVEFRAKVPVGAVLVVRDGVWGGVGGWVPVEVRIPGGNVVKFRARVSVGAVLVVRDGVWVGAGGWVPVGVGVPDGNVVKFRGNATVGAMVSVGVAAMVQDGVMVRTAAVVQDGVRGGADGKVPVGVRIKIMAEV